LKKIVLPNVAYNSVQPEDQSKPYHTSCCPHSSHKPRLSDPRQAFYAQEAREFLRKKLIGKHVKVHIDFVRPREGEFEERDCATIRYGGHGASVLPDVLSLIDSLIIA